MITRYQRSVFLRELILPIVMAVLSIAIILYGVVPGIQKIRTIIVSMDETKTENQKIKSKLNILAGLDEEELRTYVSTLLSAVPSDKAVHTIITSIENVANEKQVSVSDFSIISPGSISSESSTLSKANSKIGSNTLNVSLNVIGQTDTVIPFVGSLSRVRRLFHVSKLSLNFTGTDASPSTRMLLGLETFYTPLPATLGKASDTITSLSANEIELLSKIAAYPLVSGYGSETVGDVIPGSKIDPFSP